MMETEYPKCPKCKEDLYIDPVHGFVCMDCRSKVPGILTDKGLKAPSGVTMTEYDKVFLARCNIESKGW